MLAISSVLLGAILGLVPAATTVRLAQRKDLLPLAALLYDSFAAPEDSLRPYESRTRSWWDAQTIKLRIAMDLEQRMTPWDWSRHAQLVAEATTGDLVGFAEVWGEDKDSLANPTAQTPQPVLFNVCVAEDARRLGVGNSLLQRCEEQCSAWGDGMYLKVREGNDAAHAMYTRSGFEIVDTREPPPQPAWQERWKGGVGPLQLMRKDLSGSSERQAALAAAGAPAPKVAQDFQVTFDQVAAYRDSDAFVWFALLYVRNVKWLRPEYRFVGVGLGLATWNLWVLAKLTAVFVADGPP